jgi:hypothetical protein
VSEKFTGNSDKDTEGSGVAFMSAVVEASTLLKRAAEPRPVGDNIKAAISRAADRVTKFMPPKKAMTFSRAEDIWRQEARTIKSEEMDAIRCAAKAQKELLNAARDEWRLLDERIKRIEQALLVSDPDFARPHVDALRAATGRADRALDSGE